jgi:hypothetical protein
MVKHAVTRLKGHATLWWDELQAEHRSNGKSKIKNCGRMVAKLKKNLSQRTIKSICSEDCKT